ncbi:MAG: hypothetical protein E7221_05640 [Clostridiales bacterium]|nr:hypothetical protein [Clostridiales bacterium]
MKRKYLEKVLAVSLAISVATTPVSGIAFAAEESAGTSEVKVEEPAAPAPQKQETQTSQAQTAASQSEAQNQTQTQQTSPSEQQNTEGALAQSETGAAPAQQATGAASVQEAVAVETKAPKAAQSSYKVKIVLEDVMTTSGPSTVTAVSSVTIKAGASKTYSATTVNGWVKTKSAHYEGVTYKYANEMKDSGGRTITALTINADELEGDTTLVLRPVYTEIADMHVVVNFNNILKSNGEVTSATEQNTLSSGSGWAFSQKKLENKVSAKSFCYQGVNYKYAGYWVDEDGNEFSSLNVKNDGSAREVVYNISPVYEKSYPEVLDFRYIDNISTGSGSWKNTDAFTTYSHKFKEPAAKAHYKFVEWKNLENGETFKEGATFKYTAKKDLPEETVTSISVHAIWQPSVTVEYYNSNGKLLKSVEKTDAKIGAYDYTADTQETRNGAKFMGWYESAAEGAARVEEGTSYELPAVTADPVDQKVIKLYAKYSVNYKVEHYTENLDGSFSLAADETVEDVPAGTDVSAEAKSFEGFTFDKDIAGTLTEAKADTGLVLKLYYSRNSYNVSYEYEGDVIPADAAGQLPKATTYKYGQNVPQAGAPETAGYVFSGWNGEVEKMPAGDVVVTGSWVYAEDALAYNANGGEGNMDLTAGKTHNTVTVAENGFERYGYEFIGWNTKADGSGEAYKAGEEYKLTVNEDELFAQWKVIKVNYSTEYYLENLDGGYDLQEEESVTVEDVNMGSEAKAEIKDFTGFTFDNSVEGTLTEAKAEDGLVLKLYYSRNSYNVSYEYEGDVVPAKAEEQLPETATYKFGQDVPQADDPQVAGFEFSGWDGEVENMPAEDVTVTGSWEAIPAPVPVGNTDNDTKPAGGDKTSNDSKPSEGNQTANITDNTVPQAVQTAKAEEQTSTAGATVIEDEQMPLAATGAWALINLLCAAATAILSLVLLIGYFSRREEDEDETVETKHRLVARLVSLVPALGAIITFLITENMANPMILTDKWTRLMAAFLLVQAVVVIIAEKDKKEKKEEAEA